jgi:hypothetical protein
VPLARYEAPPRAAPSPAPTPWTSEPPQTFVPDAIGKPLKLPNGQRCQAFRDLPSMDYTVNTLVRDACLRIPDGTTIRVRDGVTLAIVATSGLFVGTNVTFDAKGGRGRRGGRAAFASIAFEPATDAEIQALCVDHGNRCACPTNEASLAPIRGRSGDTGLRGGSLHLVAAELVSPGKLVGLTIDLSGGVGGPPGDSGTQQCARGKWRCASETCSAGTLPGAPGPSGSLFLAFTKTAATVVLERMTFALATAGADSAIVTGGDAVQSDPFAALEARAIQEGWQRQAGEARY